MVMNDISLLGRYLHVGHFHISYSTLTILPITFTLIDDSSRLLDCCQRLGSGATVTLFTSSLWNGCDILDFITNAGQFRSWSATKVAADQKTTLLRVSTLTPNRILKRCLLGRGRAMQTFNWIV